MAPRFCVNLLPVCIFGGILGHNEHDKSAIFCPLSLGGAMLDYWHIERRLSEIPPGQMMVNEYC